MAALIVVDSRLARLNQSLYYLLASISTTNVPIQYSTNEESMKEEAGPYEDLLICFIGIVILGKEEDFTKTLNKVLEEIYSWYINTIDLKVLDQIKELQGVVQALALTIEKNSKEQKMTGNIL